MNNEDVKVALEDGKANEVKKSGLWETGLKHRGIYIKGGVNFMILILFGFFFAETLPNIEWGCPSEFSSSICVFRYMVSAIAVLFLLPYLYQSNMVAGVLLSVISGDSTVLVDEKGFVLAVSEGKTVYFNGSTWGIYGSILKAFFTAPINFLTGKTKGLLQICMLFDVIQTQVLLLLAVVVVLDSGSPTDILINFVVGQAVATLDDQLVALIITRKSNAHPAMTPFFLKLDEKPYDLTPFLEAPPRVLVAYGLV